MAPPAPRTVSRWLAALSLMALAGGLALAVRQWGAFATHLPAAPGPAIGSSPDSLGRDSIGRALASTESQDEKSRWRDEVPGADLASLPPERREIFLRHANARRCTCGCGYTLAACRAYDTTCEKSLPKVTALLDSVARGLIVSADGLRQPPAATEQSADGILR